MLCAVRRLDKHTSQSSPEPRVWRITADRSLSSSNRISEIHTLIPFLSYMHTNLAEMCAAQPKTWTHAESASAGRPLTEEIARDHETLRQCYENYKKATTDDEKQEWVNQYVWTNARHAIAEGRSTRSVAGHVQVYRLRMVANVIITEIIVYSIMDDLMGEEAKEITEKDRDSHQRIKEVCNVSNLYQTSS